MAIWRLIPIDHLDPSWEASSHCGPVTVRAPDETSARQTAEAAFGIKSRFVAGQGIKVPPWTRNQLVRAEVVDQPSYSAEGSTEVLEPTFVHDLQPHPPVKEPRTRRSGARRIR
jgi:hypothetical protein